MRILVADDDPVILEMLQSPMWLGASHDLTCVASAAAAMDAVKTTHVPFDVFLIDVVMPGQDGISLCAQIRSLPQYGSTPIIMITASTVADVMKRTFDAGATDFVRKPLDGLELGARINMATMLNASIRNTRTARASFDNLRRRIALGYDDVSRGPQIGSPSVLALSP